MGPDAWQHRRLDRGDRSSGPPLRLSVRGLGRWLLGSRPRWARHLLLHAPPRQYSGIEISIEFLDHIFFLNYFYIYLLCVRQYVESLVAW